jgi:hypothetical protein
VMSTVACSSWPLTIEALMFSLRFSIRRDVMTIDTLSSHIEHTLVIVS